MRTPLYQQHLQAGAKMVDFSGWQMPLHYGSQLQEHRAVRQDAGVFDVSHMAISDITGLDAKNFLRYVLANDVEKLTSGKALYSCMLNENGGVIDDLIVYHLADNFYRIVSNAGTRVKDLAWFKQQAKDFAVQITEHKDFCMLAIQGPHAREKVNTLVSEPTAKNLQNLKPFQFFQKENWLIARTGYTGEDGYEVILPIADAIKFWQALIAARIQPCGLGARDTLRLEAGLNLYGVDMDESTTPLESNLTWTVAFEPGERNFIGKAALELQRNQGVKRKLIGLILKTGGILRNHQKIMNEKGEVGEITSGSFSPTLNFSVALARILLPNEHIKYQVAIREKLLPVELVKLPFVRNGKAVFNPIKVEEKG